jgi:pantetheine-phosphate adenylyltransferase
MPDERSIKVAVYPGSFNPWHSGHSDVLAKALVVFDKVIVAVGTNPEKYDASVDVYNELTTVFSVNPRVEVKRFTGLLADFAREVSATAIVRGLRNSNDFVFEQTQQYWNEDLGIPCPIIHFISKRELVHMSSTMIRQLEKFKGK